MSAANPYPAYQQGRNEQVTWFAAPVEIGTASGRGIVALGFSLGIEPRTVEALIIDTQAAPGAKPVLLGRLLKFDPYFDLVPHWPNLRRLAAAHQLVLPPSQLPVPPKRTGRPNRGGLFFLGARACALTTANLHRATL